MKTANLIVVFFLLVYNGISAQITPTNSPYAADGSYIVTADSNLTDISIPMLFYYPETAGSYPVFMFQLGANGFGASAINRHTYDIFMKHLASYGFVVIVLDDSQAGLPNGNSFMEAHDWYTSKVVDQTHWLSTVADPSKFVVGGHSNGGVNASALLVDRPTEIDGIIFMDAYPSTGVFGFGAHDVSGYTGKEMTMAANENDPDSNEDGYNKFTSVNCKTYVNIAGMDHGGFGDYDLASQPVGSIGRDDATATVRHFLVSWMLSEFKNDSQASDQLTTNTLHPNTVEDFFNDCGLTADISETNTVETLIYPNPAQTSFTLETSELDAVDQLVITNIAGQVVLTIDVNTKHSKIDVTGLQSGTYLCTLMQNGKVIAIKRVVKD